MVFGGSLIDSFVQQEQSSDEDDWFQIVADVVLDNYEASMTSLDTFNLYLFSQKGSSLKNKVVELVKAKFSSLHSKGKVISTDWQVFGRLRWHTIYRKQCLYACNEIIRDEITRMCEEADFSEPLIPQIRDWLSDKLFAFMDKTLFIDNTATSQHNNSPLTFLKSELEVFAIHTFVEIRSKSLFEIILDFPDSLPAVKELRECVREASNLLSTVAQTLRSILEKRLLHLGASTNQILDFYIAMIKVLRIVDASDVLLHFVAAPVRAYLKSRSDSIRCIISSLTETKDRDLQDDLKVGASLAYGIDEDDEDVVLATGPLSDWSPPTRMRVLTDSELLQHQSRGLDILATLVSIYGSTDLFIAEYRNLLAEKMLDNLTYVTDTELVNVELMKIRFGEDSLHHCEVMLRDVEDSKRTNAAIVNRAKEKNESSLPVTDMVMVSEHYWPSRDADRQQYDAQKLHTSLQTLVDDYNRRYHELKKPRVLSPWLSQFVVDLTLDFDDGSSRSFKTSVFHANLIEHISEAGAKGLSAKSLSAVTEVEEEDVQLAMRYWVNKGVVRLVSSQQNDSGAEVARASESMDVAFEEGDAEDELVYVVIEEQALRMAEDASKATDTSFDQDYAGHNGDSASGSAGGSQAIEARLQAAKDFSETFVKGLLRSHGAMPLDRLQTMLTMMVRAAIENGGMQLNKVTLTTTDLAFIQHRPSFLSYLQGLVDRQVIDIDNGMYCEHK